MKSEINNVVLFVADSLRWDYLPEEIGSRGVVFKTVAAGGKTVHTFPTLSTGLRPQEYGIESWGDKLPEDVDSIFDVDSVNTGFMNSGRSFDGIKPVVGAEEQTELSELEPPFFYLERDNNTHVPHAGYDNYPKYLADRAGNMEQMIADYRTAVEDSQSLFEQRLQELDERGLLDETLVIFTSDHGELFGEYGELLHSSPLSPELVYVPAVFIHPLLTEEDFFVDPSNEVIEHVDIARTAFSLMGDPFQGIRGTDILSGERPHSYGHSFGSVSHYGITFYQANSLWWYDSGYVFTENRRLERVAFPFAAATKATRRNHMRRNIIPAIKHYLKSSHTFGNPPIDESTAKEEIERLLSNLKERMRVKTDLGDEAKDTLKDLGYLPE
jgi:hypothetical protein